MLCSLHADVVLGFDESSYSIEEGGESQSVCLRIFNQASLEIPISIRIPVSEDIQGWHG